MNNISKIAIFSLLFVSSLTIMVGTVIAPSLGAIVETINFKYSSSWLITLPSLGVVLFAPFMGKLLNKYGPYRVLIFGLIPYALLGVAGAYINNSYLLMLDRFLLGIATVSIQVSVTALIANLFSGDIRMKMIAWQGMAIELGGVVFLTLGGILGEINWKFPFSIYLTALIALTLIVKYVPMTDNHLSQVTSFNNTSKKQKLEIKIIITASLLAMMLFFVGFVTLPIYLENTFNFSESKIGYYLAFISLIAIITASQMPKVVKKIGSYKTVSLGFIFL